MQYSAQSSATEHEDEHARGYRYGYMHRSENEVVPRMVCGENQGYARAARRVRHSLNLNMNLNSGSELDSGRDRRGAAPRARARA